MNRWWWSQSDPHSQLSQQQEAVLIRVTERFEQGWNAGSFHGTPPGTGIEPNGDASIRPVLLADLCAIDLERRLKQGGTCQVETYLDLFPELADLPWAVLLLARSELSAIGSAPLSGAPAVAAAGAPDHGRFLIRSRHAEGRQSILHVAYDRVLDREVALKQLHPSFAGDMAAIHRFLREVRITASLEHPGVVPIHAAGILPDGIPFFACKLIRGQTLEEAIAELHSDGFWKGSLDPERYQKFRDLLRHLVSVCRTVAFAHSRTYVHRDIKPQNIILGAFGEVVLLDWGLARAGGSDPDSNLEIPRPREVLALEQVGSSTAAGTVVGTAVYACREQLNGDSARVGSACDIYSLGATFYHALTGQPPYPVDKPFEEVVQMVLEHRFSPPRALSRFIPKDLEAICLKAMAQAPEDRYGSAEAMAEDLVAWLDDEPVSVRREPVYQKARRWAMRHQAFSAVWAVCLLLGLLILGVSWHRHGLRQREMNSALGQMDTVSLAGVSEIVPSLRNNKRMAIERIDAFLNDPSKREQQRHVLALARLGLDPSDTSLVRRDLEASEEWTGRLFQAMAGVPPFDLGSAKGLRELLKPARKELLQPLQSLLRQVRGPVATSVLEGAGMAAIDMFAEYPVELAAVLPDLPDRIVPTAIDLLQDGPREPILATLRAFMKVGLRGWRDEPPDPSWIEPPAAAVQAIEAANGWVDPHFALCMTLPAERWLELVESLRPAGYHPSLARPYRDEAGSLRMAGLWTRDGLPFAISFGETEAAIRAAHTAHSDGTSPLTLIDLAGWYTEGSAGNTEELRLVAIWSALSSPLLEAWNRKAAFGFLAGGASVYHETKFEVGLTLDAARESEKSKWPQSDWVPRTVHLMKTKDGTVRLNRIRMQHPGMDAWLAPTYDLGPDFKERLFHGRQLLDVSIMYGDGKGSGSSNWWYGATWSVPSDRQKRFLHRDPPQAHRRAAKELASQDFRPVSLSVTCGPSGLLAASLWERRADIDLMRDNLEERKLRVALALRQFGEPSPLRELCRRAPDSTSRYLFADRVKALRVQVDDLLELLSTETDPGVQEVLLLALGSYTRQDPGWSRVAEAVDLIRKIEKETLDPGVRSAARWLIRGCDFPVPPEGGEEEDASNDSRASDRPWLVNRQGQTLVVIRDPVSFEMGESRAYAGEPEGFEARHRVRIPRCYAIMTTETTVPAFETFLEATGSQASKPSPYEDATDDTSNIPAGGVNLLEIARYANWLSSCDGIPRDQWCFTEEAGTLKLAPDYLDRAGYRLPTEAEWEYACRAGTTTIRPYGRAIAPPDPMVNRYAWHLTNSIGCAHEVAVFWPNQLGLFDMLGNVREMCLNSDRPYCEGKCSELKEDEEEPGLALESFEMVVRGGSFASAETGHFSSHRLSCDSMDVPPDVGFRLARTLPSEGAR